MARGAFFACAIVNKQKILYNSTNKRGKKEIKTRKTHKKKNGIIQINDREHLSCCVKGQPGGIRCSDWWWHRLRSGFDGVKQAIHRLVLRAFEAGNAYLRSKKCRKFPKMSIYVQITLYNAGRKMQKSRLLSGVMDASSSCMDHRKSIKQAAG